MRKKTLNPFRMNGYSRKTHIDRYSLTVWHVYRDNTNSISDGMACIPLTVWHVYLTLITGLLNKGYWIATTPRLYTGYTQATNGIL